MGYEPMIAARPGAARAGRGVLRLRDDAARREPAARMARTRSTSGVRYVMPMRETRLGSPDSNPNPTVLSLQRRQGVAGHARRAARDRDGAGRVAALGDAATGDRHPRARPRPRGTSTCGRVSSCLQVRDEQNETTFAGRRTDRLAFAGDGFRVLRRDMSARALHAAAHDRNLLLESAPILRLGFIGLGQAVARMLQQYDAIKVLPYTFAAAADPRRNALERFHDEFGAAVFTDPEEMLQRRPDRRGLHRHSAGAAPRARRACRRSTGSTRSARSRSRCRSRTATRWCARHEARRREAPRRAYS